MWVQSEMGKGTQPSETPILSLKDSPLLARVRRAMIRQEEESLRAPRSLLGQSLLSPMFDKETVHAIKKGLLWHQRDRLFSRWKERYFILTRDYLHCFRRASGSERISEMGQFLLKIKLVDVEKVEWENKKTYSAVVLNFGRDGKIYLRATEGLEEWFEFLEECTLTSKERRRALRHSHDGKSRENNNISPTLDEWLNGRQKIPLQRLFTDTVSTKHQDEDYSSFLRKRDWTPREQDWHNPSLDNRLSLLTDIDINIYDDDTMRTPSVTSYRHNKDVLCVQPPSLRPMGSFRSTRDSLPVNINGNTRKNVQVEEKPCHFIKYRERSYSDIQRVDKRSLRTLIPSHMQHQLK